MPFACAAPRALDGDTIACADGARVRRAAWIGTPERDEPGWREAGEDLRRRVAPALCQWCHTTGAAGGSWAGSATAERMTVFLHISPHRCDPWHSAQHGGRIEPTAERSGIR